MEVDGRVTGLEKGIRRYKISARVISRVGGLKGSLLGVSEFMLASKFCACFHKNENQKAGAS